MILFFFFFFSQLKFQSQNIINWSVLVSGIFNLVWTLVLVAAPCEIGERIQSEFMKLDFAISQFNWHLFPYDIRKILPIIIQNAQKPVLIQWFGSISCVRDVFKKVCSNLFSNIIIMWSNTLAHTHTHQSTYIQYSNIIFSGGQSSLLLFYGASWICSINDLVLKSHR